MVQALAGVALFEFTQIQPGAEVRAFAVDHRSTHGRGQFLEDIAQGQDEAVGQRVALGTTCEADHCNLFVVAANFELDVLVLHG